MVIGNRYYTPDEVVGMWPLTKIMEYADFIKKKYGTGKQRKQKKPGTMTFRQKR